MAGDTDAVPSVAYRRPAALSHPSAGLVGAAIRIGGILRRCQRAAAPDALGLGLLALAVLVSFRESISGGLVAAEKDTRVFFYPLQTWFAEEFKAGRFPLWNPYIFGGYPMFADGEIGLAYPLHLLLLYLLPASQVFVWLRVSSVLIAAASMYALCRALGLRRLPSLLGGLTFALGSFFPSQQHHENVIRTAAWLPLVLACTEWALQRAGWRRHAFLTAAAAALAMSALGLHPQMLAMGLLAFAIFVVFRVSTGPIGGRTTSRPEHSASGESVPSGGAEHGAASRRIGGHGWRLPLFAYLRLLIGRVALVGWVGGYVGGIGLSLAAVQLLPLAQLGAATYRGSQPDYFFATSYALPLYNLVDLLFPYFFRGPDASYWSLWAKWETTLYVGIAPLVLGVLGALLLRRREAFYFLGISAFGLWLAFASYAPFDLYGVLWQLPGFSAFRVPGRYTYLFVLGWAVLSAFGLQAVQDARRDGSRTRRVAALGLLTIMAMGGLGLIWAMASLRSALVLDPTGAMAWIRDTYLSLRHHPEGIAASEVYRGLVHSLGVATPRTAFALGTLALALVLVAGALVARRGPRWWQVGLVGLAAGDLLAFGVGLHQKATVEQLRQITPALQFLTGAKGYTPQPEADRYELQTDGGLRPSTLREWRVFTSGTIPSLEFDRLVLFGLEDIGGYSSAEPRGNFAYWVAIASAQNQVIDLANVRYLVYPARPSTLPSYRRVPFDPDRPLMLGSKDSVGGRESYRVGGVPAHRLQVVAVLTRAVEVPQGARVAEITVVPREGEPAVIPLQAGADVAEWAYDRPDVRGKIKHRRSPEIAFLRPDVFPLDGTPYHFYLYYSEHDLPRAMEVERLEIRYVYPVGGMELYGLSLYNFDTGETAGVTPQMRSTLRPVYRDQEVMIMENLAAFPRAYVVSGAVIAPEGETPLSAMLSSPFDPTREVMLNGPRDGGPIQADGRTRARQDTESGSASARRTPVTSPREVAADAKRPTPAEALYVGTDRALYRALAPSGGYFVHVANFFPGWRAWVDGQEAPIFQANGLFRAVPLTAGEHLVELRYEPAAVELGLLMSGWAALAALATLTGALVAAWLPRRR